jgi:hypothetical protein
MQVHNGGGSQSQGTYGGWLDWIRKDYTAEFFYQPPSWSSIQ